MSFKVESRNLNELDDERTGKDFKNRCPQTIWGNVTADETDGENIEDFKIIRSRTIRKIITEDEECDESIEAINKRSSRGLDPRNLGVGQDDVFDCSWTPFRRDVRVRARNDSSSRHGHLSFRW